MGKRVLYRIVSGLAGTRVCQRAVRRWASASAPRAAARVLFVCKGNICRSAYSEWAARRMFGLRDGWEFASAGLEATPGAKPPEAAIRVAWERDVDLRHHRARLVGDFMPENIDVVFVMEPLQLWDRRLAPFREKCGVVLLGALAGAPLIADPYGRSDAEFRACFDLIDAAIRQLDRRGANGD